MEAGDRRFPAWATLCIALTSAMSVAAHFGAYKIALVAFVPLFLIFFQDSISKRQCLLSVAVSSVFFVLFSMATHIYVLRYDIIAYYVLVVLIQASFYILFAALGLPLCRSLRSPLKIFIPPILWVILLRIYSFNPFGSFRADFAACLPEMFPVIRIFGNLGGTFLIILFNAMLAYYLMLQWTKDRKSVKRSLFWMILGMLVFFTACFVLSDILEPEGEPVRVALIQADFRQDFDWRYSHPYKILYDNHRLSKEAAEHGPDIIIWPESAVMKDAQRDKESYNLLNGLARETGATLITGTFQDLALPVRYNAADVFGADGTYSRRLSTRPLPFSRDIARFDESHPLDSPFGKIAVLICFEENMYDLPRDMVREGARLIVGMSNNQFFMGSHVFGLLAQTPKLNAAANNRYFLRATNNGITEIVNPYGKTTHVLEPEKRGYLIADIMLIDKNTFYNKYGNWPLSIIIMILVILIIAAGAKERLREKSKKIK